MQREEDMPHMDVFVAEGPLRKLYDRIRSQRDNWQQRSVHESRDAAVNSESALHKVSTDKEG